MTPIEFKLEIDRIIVTEKAVPHFHCVECDRGFWFYEGILPYEALFCKRCGGECTLTPGYNAEL